MTGTQALEAMGEEEILEFAGACAQTAWRAEVDLLRAAYQWAVVHPAGRLDPREAAMPGREDARRLGGEGTPEVAGFAAAEFGARIGRSPYAAARLIGDALDLHHRHPQLWARVRAGEVRASYARHVTARTRDLSREAAAYVDAGVAESADGRICWSRFEALVEAKVAQADPAATREREERAAKARFARRLRGEAHGMASFLVRADVGTVTALEAAVTAYAHHLATVMPAASEDERRVYAVLLLVCGRRELRREAAEKPRDTDLPSLPDPSELPELPELPELLPTVTLYVHTYAGPEGGGIARVEGHGPVTEEWVRAVLGPTARFKVQPVLDLAGQAPVDAYEIPDRHRQAVQLMTPADTFPFAACTSRRMQVDHTVPYDQGGVSGVGNYGPMTTGHHRIKTHGRWQVRQPFPGIYLWRDPHGAHYLVDHTGTRQLTPTRAAAGVGRPVFEIWRTPFAIKIDLAA